MPSARLVRRASSETAWHRNEARTPGNLRNMLVSSFRAQLVERDVRADT